MSVPGSQGHPKQDGNYDPSNVSLPPAPGGYPLPLQSVSGQTENPSSRYHTALSTHYAPSGPGISSGTGYGPNHTQVVASQNQLTPVGFVNCPPQLINLLTTDKLLVQQNRDLSESFMLCIANNEYSVKNNLGHDVYYAEEDNNCLTRNFCGALRPFNVKIFDNGRNEVIHLYKPFLCWLQTIEVCSPPGVLIGTVNQECTFGPPTFAICNAYGETVLRILSPVCYFRCCGDVEFRIVAADRQIELGKIIKEYIGCENFCAKADHFRMTFPNDLDVNIKAVLLGACILIDFMYYY